MTALFERFVLSMRRQIGLMIGRAVVKLVNDAGGFQRVQLVGVGYETNEIPRAQNYGMTSNPLPGAAAVFVCANGQRNKAVAIAVDDPRYRPQSLQPGEVEIYTDEGDYIKLARGRLVQIVAGAKVTITAPEVDVIASTKVLLQTPLVEATQNVKVDGQLTVVGQLIGQGGMALSGGGASAASITGNLVLTSGNVTADGIGLKTHVHADAQGGLTGVPQ